MHTSSKVPDMLALHGYALCDAPLPLCPPETVHLTKRPVCQALHDLFGADPPTWQMASTPAECTGSSGVHCWGLGLPISRRTPEEVTIPLLLTRYRSVFSLENDVPFLIPVNHDNGIGPDTAFGFRWVYWPAPSLSAARQGPDLLTAQSLLAHITYAQGCGLGPSAHHLVLVNRADLFLRLRDHLNRRASSQAPPELGSVLDNSHEVATEALSRFVQLETTVRAAGATARTCTLWQNGVGFLSSDQDGHARATVALTRALTCTYIFSPPDMGGLIGMAQTLAAWEHGVWLLEPSRAPDFLPSTKGHFRERVSLLSPLPWNRIPLAIAERCAGGARVLRLVVVRIPMAWRLQRHEYWREHRYLLPEAPSHSDPTLCWGYAAEQRRKPLWYLWPSRHQLYLWHHKGQL